MISNGDIDDRPIVAGGRVLRPSDLEHPEISGVTESMFIESGDSCPDTVSGFMSLFKVPLVDEHLRRLSIIDCENYTGVIKKTREVLTEMRGEVPPDTYLARGILGLKQYYAVALLDPANAHAISAELDPFWHAHILHSEQYERFCRDVVGEFMHHIPLDRDNQAQVENLRVLYDYTIEVLDRLFIKRDTKFWPSEVPDIKLICYHKGNVEVYPDVQSIRLYEPTARGRSVAFAS
jgi:hypothetical protein